MALDRVVLREENVVQDSIVKDHSLSLPIDRPKQNRVFMLQIDRDAFH